MDGVKKTLLASAVALSVGLLVELEGYSPKPYLDIAGVLTECYGNTHNVDVNNPKTEAQCKVLLNNEAARIGVMLLNDVPNHNLYTLASGISFVYNVGDGAYRSSTYRKELKRGNFEAACNQMYRWVYVTKGKKKVVSKGLKNRRDKEVEVCLRGSLS